MGFWKNLRRKATATSATDPFGPFAPVCAGGYLSLLWMSSDDVPLVLTDIADALSSPDGRGYVTRMLEDENWRSHLIATIAAPLSPDPSNFAPALWAAFDRGSWVAPQLAVALWFSDPEFTSEAKRRVVARCPVAVPEDVARPEGLLAFQRREISAKNLASLSGVLSHVPSEAAWIMSELAAGDVQALLKSDVDSAGEIVDSWSKTARDRFAQYGRSLSPPVLSNRGWTSRRPRGKRADSKRSVSGRRRSAPIRRADE
jgi:hypothetical protein